jgi:hypothetical protein
MPCIDCARGFHGECGDPCCCAGLQEKASLLSESLPIALVSGLVGRPPKPDDEISVSAGRKRAASSYELEMGDDKLCEWLGLANCGGGFKPIIGCLRGRRQHIHHGPDKDTSNNERHNISLICHLCHNRWHAANNSLYGKVKCPEGIQPKNPRPMTKEEFVQAIAFETNRKE